MAKRMKGKRSIVGENVVKDIKSKGLGVSTGVGTLKDSLQ